jgi:glycosyltransferase involved in cell wall biosynthesis
MKVMILTPWFYPAYKAGGPIQSLVNLVEQPIGNIEFYVLTSNSDVDNSILDTEKCGVWTKFNRHTSVMYLQKKSRTRMILHQIRATLPDIILITGIYSVPFTILPVLFSKCRIIISARGMLHPPALKKKAIKKRFYLIFFRPLIKLKNIVFHATDDDEKDHIHAALGNRVEVKVAQNIPAFFEPNLLTKDRGSLHLITIALISPMKNHLLVLQALKNIESYVHYHICGPIFDDLYWNRCQVLIAELPPNIRVHYHGPVPPVDVFRYLSAAHVFICPSESENFGHALFEAMSAGKPLITSNTTPWNDLFRSRAGINTDISEGSLRDSIRFFINMDEREYSVWSRSAAEYARGRINISAIRDQYKKLFYS